MKLFRIDGLKLKSIKTQPFKTEKEIQTLVEKNLMDLFGLEMVQSELSVKNYRLDTLCFDKENKSFVIVEYKKDRNYSVIDQGYTYLSLLLNNKSDFVLEYNERMGKNLRRDDIDWSQSRILFISPNFTDYQKQSVNFKDVPFELWEIKRYEDDHLILNQHKTDSEVSITTTSTDTSSVVSNVSRQVMVYTENYHLYEVKNRKESVVELYNRFRERVLSFGDVEIVPRKFYISFQKGRPFTDVEFQKDNLLVFVNMKKGTLNDPNRLTIDVSGKGHQGNGDYSFQLKEDSDLDYLMFLINQSYKDKGQ